MILINAVSCMITFVTLIIAFTWKPRAGKILICMSLLLSFIASSTGIALISLVASGIRPVSQYIRIFSFFSGFLHLASITLLLCFVIVARDNYAFENHHVDSK